MGWGKPFVHLSAAGAWSELTKGKSVILIWSRLRSQALLVTKPGGLDLSVLNWTILPKSNTILSSFKFSPRYWPGWHVGGQTNTICFYVYLWHCFLLLPLTTVVIAPLQVKLNLGRPGGMEHVWFLPINFEMETWATLLAGPINLDSRWLKYYQVTKHGLSFDSLTISIARFRLSVNLCGLLSSLSWS